MPSPFLTQLDIRAQVKGSRDPLGTQPIWSAFGRQVVNNLTTVSTSVRDFTTLLLGYWFAEQLPEQRALDVFLRWEQWAAYSRTQFTNNTKNSMPVRGVERVKQRLLREKPVTISSERDHQILSQQQTYGLWGIYSSPARSSGLLEPRGEGRFLSDAARNFVEHEYAPKLKAAAGGGKSSWLQLLAQARVKCDWQGEHEGLLKAVARVLASAEKPLSPTELSFYREHLLHGGPQSDSTKQSVQVLQIAAAKNAPPRLVEKQERLSPAILRTWQKAAKRHGDMDLEACLRKIEVAESVMAPAVRLFDFLVGQPRREETSVIKDIKKEWGGAFRDLPIDEFLELREEIGAKSPGKSGGADWVAVAEALRNDDFGPVVERLCHINEAVMQERGGTAWIKRESGKIEVKYGESSQKLLPAKEISNLWLHSYFLDSLALVAGQLTLKS